MPIKCTCPPTSDTSFNTHRTFIAFILLLFIIIPIYSNTYNASWHLDDEPNIENNSKLHIDNLMPSTLYRTFFAYPGDSKALYRPLPCLTFALNWYFSQDDPTGFHIVNIVIHILTAFFLFITCIALFRTPALKGRYPDQAVYFISLLSAVLWAVNPVQTQAVTYIVQRMAAMAAMFYILALYFYIQARTCQTPHRRILLYFGCLFSFLCALGSKENAATFMLVLPAVEIAFFQHSKLSKSKTAVYRLVTGISIFLLLLIIAIYSKGDLYNLIGEYGHRYFSPMERVLTEFRILIFHLSQLIYPLPQRLSIAHDIPISTSLLEPWTTLPAILSVFILIAIAIVFIKKRPIIGFAILFFFTNHLVESTVIQLELIFEHRNYLPSAFLFLPVALGFWQLLNHYTDNSPFMHTVLVIFMTLSIGLLSMGTYIRNWDWLNERTLWQDAMLKAPKHARPPNVIAIDLAWGKNRTPINRQRGLYLLKKSMALYKPSKYLEAGILGNIAMIYFQQGDFENAVQYYRRAMAVDPHIKKIRYDMASMFALMQRWDDANAHLDFLLDKVKDRADWLNLKGLILLWQNQPQHALSYLRPALYLAPEKPPIWLNIGVALTMIGEYPNGRWFLNRARQLAPDDVITFFSLIENRVRGRDLRSAAYFADRLCRTQSLTAISEVKANLLKTPKTVMWAPVSVDTVLPLIEDALRKLTAEFPNEIFQQGESTD